MKFNIAHFPVGTIFEVNVFPISEGPSQHEVTGIVCNGPHSWVLNTNTLCDFTGFKAYNISHVTRIIKRGDGEVKMMNSPFVVATWTRAAELPKHHSQYMTVYPEMLVRELIDRIVTNDMLVDINELTNYLRNAGVLHFTELDPNSELGWCYCGYYAANKKKLKKTIKRVINKFCVNREKAQHEQDDDFDRQADEDFDYSYGGGQA